MKATLFLSSLALAAAADFKWPAWPNNSIMEGTDIGPFPFWCDTHNQSKGAYKYACLDRDTTQHHNVKVIYSYDVMAQISIREHCDLSNFGGDKDVTCSHRFMPNGKAFVTYGDEDDGYCCQSFGHLPQTNPLPIPHPNFMDTCLSKTGPTHYEGKYYQGDVYNYSDVFLESPTYFFYYTAADDERPIAQGEGCVIDLDRAGECTAAGKTSRLGPTIGDPAYTLLEYEKFYEDNTLSMANFSLPASCSGPGLRECYNMECDAPPPGEAATHTCMRAGRSMHPMMPVPGMAAAMARQAIQPN